MTDPKGAETPQEEISKEKKAPAKKPAAKKPAATKSAASKKAAPRKAAAKPAETETLPAASAENSRETATLEAGDTAKSPAKKPAAKSTGKKTGKTIASETGPQTEPPAAASGAQAAANAAGTTPKAKKTPAKSPAKKTPAKAPAAKAAGRAPAGADRSVATAAAAEPAEASQAKDLAETAKAVSAPRSEAPAEAPRSEAPVEAPVADAMAPAAPSTEVPADTAPKGKRSRGRGSRGKKEAAGRAETASTAKTRTVPAQAPHAASPAEAAVPLADVPLAGDETPFGAPAMDGAVDDEAGGEKKRRSRSRRGRRKKGGAGREAAAAVSADDPLWAEAIADVDPMTGFEEDTPAEEVEEVEEVEEEKPQKAEAAEAPKGRLPRRKMFVSVQPEEQVEVVITEEGQVLEYYVEMLHQAKTKGNIYKASISNVDANLQAAFVNYGAVKNGFLQIDEVHPEYYVAGHEPGKGRKYPPIQKVLKPGQEVLVQVVKEPTGTKGAFLTTYLSLPGRFLVLTPGREQIGVSRKVENETERARLREMLGGLTPGPGLGVIVRTVSMGVDKALLETDLEQLKKRWVEVRNRGTAEPSPSLIYQEMELVARAVRDYLTDQVAEVWVDDEKTAAAVAEVALGLFPRKTGLVRVHGKDQTQPLFERFNIQRQVEQIHSREVTLPSGGRLVIDPTEALTAIDINSGRSGGKNNFEDMAYRTNIEAAKMIPLQLRLRDIGGQVVVDFIEMRDKNHWREVEKTVRQGMKVDRARYDVGKMGPFGMLEIVRQRLGSSAISVSTEPCPHCKGTGVRRNMEWQSQQALREVQRLLQTARESDESADHLVYEAEPDLAMHLLNQKRRRLAELEQAYGLSLEIRFKSATA